MGVICRLNLLLSRQPLNSFSQSPNHRLTAPKATLKPATKAARTLQSRSKNSQFTQSAMSPSSLDQGRQANRVTRAFSARPTSFPRLVDCLPLLRPGWELVLGFVKFFGHLQATDGLCHSAAGKRPNLAMKNAGRVIVLCITNAGINHNDTTARRRGIKNWGRRFQRRRKVSSGR